MPDLFERIDKELRAAVDPMVTSQFSIREVSRISSHYGNNLVDSHSATCLTWCWRDRLATLVRWVYLYDLLIIGAVLVGTVMAQATHKAELKRQWGIGTTLGTKHRNHFLAELSEMDWGIGENIFIANPAPYIESVSHCLRGSLECIFKRSGNNGVHGLDKPPKSGWVFRPENIATTWTVFKKQILGWLIREK